MGKSEKFNTLALWIKQQQDEVFADALPFKALAEKYFADTGTRVSAHMISEAVETLSDDPFWPGYCGRAPKLKHGEKNLWPKQWDLLFRHVRPILESCPAKPTPKFVARVMQARGLKYRSVESIAEAMRQIGWREKGGTDNDKGN